MAFMPGPFIFEDKDGTHVLIVPEDYYPEFLGHDEWGLRLWNS